MMNGGSAAWTREPLGKVQPWNIAIRTKHNLTTS